MSINKSDLYSLYPTQHYFKTYNFSVELEIDDCKQGEVFDGSACKPCEINRYLETKGYGGTIKCQPCTDFDTFFCYGANYSSPNLLIGAKSKVDLNDKNSDVFKGKHF